MYKSKLYAVAILLIINSSYSAEFKKESAEIGIAMHIEDYLAEIQASDTTFKKNIADCITRGAADINNPTYINHGDQPVTPLERALSVPSYDSAQRINRIEALISLSANVNTINKSKGMHSTPLHHAIKNAHFNAALLLLHKYNARCDIKNNNNQTPIRLLCATPIDWEKLSAQESEQACNLLSTLLEKTPVMCASLSSELTLIEEAQKSGNLAMIPLLKEYGIK